MGMFEQFPYSNFHELNLDWIINKLNELGQNAVLSVNGQTGDVVLYQHPYVEFPEITANSWKLSRTASGKDVGIYFANDHLYFVDGAAISKVYTETDTPPYPVTSVNGQTGAIELYQEAGIRFPNVTDGYFNTRRQINTGAADQAIVGLEVDETKAKRIKDNLRYDIYDTGNPPPYPVSSVNGQTGAVILAIPFNGPLSDSTWMASTPSATHQAGMARETMDGTVSIYTVSDANHAEAFVKFVSADEQTTYTKKLLTTDDIPSGAGVVSVNGLSGVVLITGSEINTNAIDGRTINQDVQSLYAADALIRDEIGIVGSGNQCAVSVSAGQYVILKDSTIAGCSDGLYTAAQAIPANTTIDSTYLTAVSGGGLNALNDAIANVRNDVTHLKFMTKRVDAAKTQIINGFGNYNIAIAAAFVSGTGTCVFVVQTAGSTVTITHIAGTEAATNTLTGSNSGGTLSITTTASEFSMTFLNATMIS